MVTARNSCSSSISLLALLLCLFCGATNGRAQDGLAMMRAEFGARPSGMGLAVGSLSGGPDFVIYNPASGSSSQLSQFSIGHNTYWQNIGLTSTSMTVPVAPKWTVIGNIRYASIGDLESRQIPSSEPEALFSANDFAIKGGVAYQVAPKVSFGIAAGWFVEKIDAWRGSAFNVDLGVLATVTPLVSIGASATNLGSNFTLQNGGLVGSRDISLPTSYRVGASYRKDRYLGSIDLVSVDDEIHPHVGAEATLHDSFSIRAGYQGNYDSKNFTAGLSLSRKNIAVDYAFVPYKHDLGTSHMFNLCFSL